MAEFQGNRYPDIGAIPPTDLEEHTHPFGESNYAAKIVVEPLPAAFNSILNVDYAGRTDGNPVYVGYNVRGAQDADVTWLIQRITYDVNGNPLTKRLSTDSWDNRDSATYE